MAAVAAHRSEAGITASLDVAVGGRCRLPSVDDERAAVDAAARGGATWWLEFVHPGPDADMLAAVRRGPVRATRGALSRAGSEVGGDRGADRGEVVDPLGHRHRQVDAAVRARAPA